MALMQLELAPPLHEVACPLSGPTLRASGCETGAALLFFVAFPRGGVPVVVGLSYRQPLFAVPSGAVVGTCLFLYRNILYKIFQSP